MKPATLILQTAADVLSQPENWTQKAIARDSRGFRVSAYSDSANQWCALGAICRAAKVLFGGNVPGKASRSDHPHISAALVY